MSFEPAEQQQQTVLLENAPVQDSEPDRLIEQRMAGFEAEDESVSLGDVPSLLEALLLAAPGPVRVADLAEIAGWPVEVIEEVLASIDTAEGRGWVVQRHGATVQLATDPRFASQVRRMLGFEREARLSAAALETLAIVAYQQPVVRTAIEAVRGVDSSGVLTTLLNRGLVESRQRPDLPGQPFEYRTTPLFLQHFGLRSLEDLPELNGPDGADLGDALASTIEEAVRAEPAFELEGSTVQASSA